ncbi:hypothetical protein CALCODRAFT_497331 [Calocera cornea HHB12733]|uniref:Pre-rRNA-processing protein RIX1 n=1 Tax=Calocera cornea HHB12733 TaxID=1353952 RepID=A0A165FCD3_9BASI|nr:hypothetical protein CALCODRAFT_497331 [Calocera cornea HHB12733]
MFAFLTDKLDSLDASIAERTFERLQPRYTVPGRSFVRKGWQAAQATYDDMLTLLDTNFAEAASSVYACNPDSKRSMDSALGAIALLVHCYPSQLAELDVGRAFSRSQPVVLRVLGGKGPSAGAGTTGVVLAWLWALVLPAQAESVHLEQELLVPIIQHLVPLSSLSPAPSTRFIAFRLLSFLLGLLPPLSTLSLLRSFLAPECPFPQMRVAAVGLVKEHVLAALRSPVASPFSTPLLMQTLGPVLLRPQPADLFSPPAAPTLAEFVDSSEPARLVECMSLLYVLLQVDTQNRTAARDALPELTVRVLTPLRALLTLWQPQMERDDEVSMALSGLVISLERFDALSISIPMPIS